VSDNEFQEKAAEALRSLREAFEAAPVGLSPERYRMIVLELVRVYANEGEAADDEIASSLGMSWLEVWSVRKELDVLAGAGEAEG